MKDINYINYFIQQWTSPNQFSALIVKWQVIDVTNLLL